MLEEKILDLYQSIKLESFEKVVPIIDFYRKLKSKPPLPLMEKTANIDFPDFSKDKVILLHGVSVGEVLSLENLIKRIKSDFKNTKLIVTTGTITGQELAHKKYGKIADFITYFPLDIYKSTEKFLEKTNPSVVLIAETELWPNFSLCCRRKNIPLYIINGRISDKSYPSYLKIKKFFSLVLENYTGIFCQSEIDKDRFLALGASCNHVDVMKNLKFEISKKKCDINLCSKGFKVFIAASTHKGEDIIALETYHKLKSKIKNLKMIIAPRHLNRIDEVKSLCSKFPYGTGLKTKKDDFINKDIIILDTLGELSKIYDITDVAFIGGSFNKTGGHNPLEAAVYSKPTISGPFIKNFRDIYSILTRENASFVVKNKIEFYNTLEKLVTDDEYYNTVSSNCKNCFNNQQGALDFVINKLKRILDY